jgi:hypothetical protein
MLSLDQDGAVLGPVRVEEPLRRSDEGWLFCRMRTGRARRLRDVRPLSWPRDEVVLQVKRAPADREEEVVRPALVRGAEGGNDPAVCARLTLLGVATAE